MSAEGGATRVCERRVTLGWGSHSSRNPEGVALSLRRFVLLRWVDGFPNRFG